MVSYPPRETTINPGSSSNDRALRIFNVQPKQISTFPTPVQAVAPMATHVHSLAETKIHTAKCDVCDKRNKSTMYRCSTCHQQTCKPCYSREKRLVIDEDGLPYQRLNILKKRTARFVEKARARSAARCAYLTETLHDDCRGEEDLCDHHKRRLKGETTSHRSEKLTPKKRRRVIRESTDGGLDARVMARARKTGTVEWPLIKEKKKAKIVGAENGRHESDTGMAVDVEVILPKVLQLRLALTSEQTLSPDDHDAAESLLTLAADACASSEGDICTTCDYDSAEDTSVKSASTSFARPAPTNCAAMPTPTPNSRPYLTLDCSPQPNSVGCPELM